MCFLEELRLIQGVNVTKYLMTLSNTIGWIFFGLDVYFHHEHETKNYQIENRVATRPMCAVASEMLFEARAWNVDGKSN